LIRKGWFALVCGVALGLILPMQGLAQEILIVRPLEKNEVEVSNPAYLFEVEVSAFSRITEVSVNGKRQNIQPDTYITLKVPLQLKPGRNRVRVNASTADARVEKEFFITLRQKGDKAVSKKDEGGEKGKDGFQMVTMLGGTRVTNPRSKPGSVNEPIWKFFLIALPTYNWRLSPANALEFQGIVSRESYWGSNVRDLEVAFTQASASWVLTSEGQSHLKMGLGYNYIFWPKNKHYLYRSYIIEDDTLSFLELHWQINPAHSLTLGWTGTNKDLADKSPFIDYEGDGTATNVDLTYTLQLDGLRLKLDWGSGQTNTVGRYLDDSSSKYGLDVSMLAGDFIFGLKASSTQNTKDEVDPAFGVAGQVERSATGVYTNYVLSDSVIFNLDFTANSQSSNLPDQTFDNTAMTLALIYIFQ